MNYCVTTVSLPDLALTEQVQLLQDLGYDGMELRVRRVTDEQRQKPPSCWGYHVNDISPDNFRAQADEIRTVLADHGLKLAGLATNVSCTDLEHVKLILDGAVACGAPFFRVGAASGYDRSRPYRQVYGETVAGYARVLELTRGTGVKVVLEIHGGTIHPSASLAYRIVSNFDPAAVGVIYDPQNMVRDGFETTALALDVLGPYLAHCHVGAHRPLAAGTDANGTTAWKWEGCPLGEGLYNYPELVANLRKTAYKGFISVEDFRPCPAREKLTDAIRYLKAVDSA